ncbi:MAG: DUF3306 domain-containing protein [Alphaproteobacteria bacterium]|nr:DUF3306 domain-containing protein [Alphaproteobacteria bacterium]
MTDEPEDPAARPEATDDGFLTRWSRRKQAARAAAEAGEPPAPAKPAEQEEEPFDPASLPPVESLGPESDYAPFLHRKVPEALRQAALRRLWVTEPSVVNYQPLVDYAWDFTAPGYGALAPGDDVADLARQVLEGIRGEERPADREPRQVAAVPQSLPETANAQSDPPSNMPEPGPSEPASATDESRPGAPSATHPRRHGGALPQ